MIKRLNRLRDFGIYRDFSGDAASGLPEFNKFNLIYGWNYSGKTTLSRAFAVIGRGELPDEYRSATIEFESDSGVVGAGHLSPAPKVRVFNRNYVEENFVEEHTAPAVFIVGAESAALRARLEQLETRWEGVECLCSDWSDNKAALQNLLDKLYTDNARTIGKILGVRDFRAPDLKIRVNQVRSNADDFILSEEALEAAISTWRTSDDSFEIPLVASPAPSLDQILAETDALLDRTASNDALEDLKENPSLEDWVRRGRALHESRDKCGFCGSDFTEDRKAALGAHFSAAYERLINDLDEKIAQIIAVRLEIQLPHPKDLMPEVRDCIDTLKIRYEEWSVWAQAKLDELVAELEEKKLKIEAELKSQVDCSRSAQGQTLIGSINAHIERNNELVLNVDDAKRDARGKIEKHYAVTFFEEEGIQAKEDEITRVTSRVIRASKVTAKIQEQIREIKERISKAAVGAIKLNELLEYLLADSNIEVQSTGEAEFRFLRGGNPANNLSDGEKTAVTLAYFLTSLEAEGESLEDTIVFIDDPICSLDSNHIYAVYALIAERLEKSRQLFVSTHNSEFFNLLKGRWFGSAHKDKTSAYYVRRYADQDGNIAAVIEDLPRLLRKFKSEYEFVFWHLTRFAEDSPASDHEAYTAPNLLRRFLEAYLGFRRPHVRAWHQKLDILFDNPDKRREIHKFCDDASHMQSLSRSMQQPAFIQTAQDRVRDVLGALENKDKAHYDSLVSVVSGV